jgi:hypothetical protein
MASAMQLRNDFLLPLNPSITLKDVAFRLSQMSQLPRTVHCDRLSGGSSARMIFCVQSA